MRPSAGVDDGDLEELSFFHHENVTVVPDENRVFDCNVLVQGESATIKAIPVKATIGCDGIVLEGAIGIKTFRFDVVVVPTLIIENGVKSAISPTGHGMVLRRTQPPPPAFLANKEGHLDIECKDAMFEVHVRTIAEKMTDVLTDMKPSAYEPFPVLEPCRPSGAASRARFLCGGYCVLSDWKHRMAPGERAEYKVLWAELHVEWSKEENENVVSFNFFDSCRPKAKFRRVLPFVFAVGNSATGHSLTLNANSGSLGPNQETADGTETVIAFRNFSEKMFWLSMAESAQQRGRAIDEPFVRRHNTYRDVEKVRGIRSHVCLLPLLNIKHTIRTTVIDDHTSGFLENLDKHNVETESRHEVSSGAMDSQYVVDKMEHKEISMFMEKKTVVSQHSFEPSCRVPTDRNFRSEMEANSIDHSEKCEGWSQAPNASWPQDGNPLPKSCTLGIGKVSDSDRRPSVRMRHLSVTTRSETCVTREEKRTSSVQREKRTVVSSDLGDKRLVGSVETKDCSAMHNSSLRQERSGSRTSKSPQNNVESRRTIGRCMPAEDIGSQRAGQVPDGNLTRDGCAKPNSTSLAIDSGSATSSRTERQESSQRSSVRQRSREVATMSEMTRERNEVVSSATFKHERFGAHHSAAPSSKITVNCRDHADVDSVSGDVRDVREGFTRQVFGNVSGPGADTNRTSDKLDTEAAKGGGTAVCGPSELQRKAASSQRSVAVTHVESTQRMVSGMDKDGKVLGSQRSGQVPDVGLPRDGCARVNSNNLSSDSGTAVHCLTVRQESDTRPSLRQRSNDVTTKSEVNYEYEHIMSSATSEVLAESSQFRNVTSSEHTVDNTSGAEGSDGTGKVQAGCAAVTTDFGGRHAGSDHTGAKSPLPSGCNIPQVGGCADVGRQQSDVSVASSKTNLWLPCGTASDSRRQGQCTEGSRKTWAPCQGAGDCGGRFAGSPNRRKNSHVPFGGCAEHVQSYIDGKNVGDYACRFGDSPNRNKPRPPNPFGVNDLEDEKLKEREIPVYADCPDVGDFAGRFGDSPRRKRTIPPKPFGVNELADAGGRQG